MARNAGGKRHKSEEVAPQCLLSSPNPKSFGKKAATAVARALSLNFVAAEEQARPSQTSLFFYSSPMAYAEIRDVNRPVLPLSSGKRWLHISIDLNAVGGAKWRVNHISIGLLQGELAGPKRMVLRAEWMMFEQIDTSGHAQPHWHVIPPEAPNLERDFETVIAASSGFMQFLEEGAHEAEPAIERSTKGLEHFHYAMAADWHAKPPGSASKFLQDEAAAIAWLQGCVGYIVRQLEHVDHKAGEKGQVP